MYSLGIDIGTSSICVTVTEPETGKNIYTCTNPNNSTVPGADTYEKIQSAEKIMSQTISLTEDILEKFPGKIECIGVTGQMHGIVYVDKKCSPVSPLYTWQDGRAGLERTPGENYSDYIKKTTGYNCSIGYGCATHFYDIENGLVPNSAVGFCTIHDLLAATLCSLSFPITHVSDAASLGLYDLIKSCFDFNAARNLGIDPKFLPIIADGETIIGKTASGIPVTVAIGDNQASFLGTVSEPERSVLVNVGTGSQISVIGNYSQMSGSVECRPFIDGKFIYAGSSLCGGRAYAMLEKFFRMTAGLCGYETDSFYPFMDKALEDIAESGKRLKVSTLFAGTRSDPSERGSISNISIDNFTPENLMYGFLEGIAAELYGMYSKIPVVKAPDILIGSGNGIRYNKALQRCISKLFGLPLSVSETREEAAAGAAKLAARVCGLL